MRICIYGYTIGTKGNGSSQYALDLAKYLQIKGCEVTLLTGGFGNRNLISEKIKINFLTFYPSPLSIRAQIDFALKSFYYFKKNKNKFDLIHSLSSFPQFGRLASWVKRWAGLPVIHTLLAPCEYRSFLYRLDGLISVSKGIQEKIRPAQSVYIPPPIDFERFHLSSPYDWDSPKGFLIGTMGAPFRRKGIRYLVEAIPMVLKKIPDVSFFLAINLPGIEWMEETRREKNYIDWFIQEKRLREKVTLLGPVDVPRFLKSLDLFVYAVQTTFGMIDIPPTLLECLAAGCALITTRKDGITELIKDGYNGLLLNEGDHQNPEAYANKIIELFQDKMMLEKVKNNGPKSIEQFELNRVGQKILNFYEKILEKRS